MFLVLSADRLDNVRLRLSDEGEILVKGPNAMMGVLG